MKVGKIAGPVLAAGAAALLGAGAVSADNGLARGHLYSTAAVNQICSTAQQIVTASNVEVSNSIFSDWDAFVQSDAAPWSVVGGFPPLAYAPPEEPDLPLTSTQHVIYGLYGTGNRDYPQVVSCKMKNADYLNATNAGLGAVDQPCEAVHQYYVDAVVASLTNPEDAQYVMEPDEIIESDDPADNGPLWTAGFPDDPYPVLYRETEGGPIHVKSRRLYVEPHPTGAIFACNSIVPSLPPGVPIPSFCEPRKWGVRYCHLAAPEYIREAFTGGVDVPVIPGGP